MISCAFRHFGGRLTDSACLKNLLAHAGVANPADGCPFSEPLCFGLAGGIGAGYSFCPSVPRSGHGSGVSIPGRYKAFATDAVWYQGFFDRLGIPTRITETSATGKALQNIKAELAEGRPTVVWCGRGQLPYLGGSIDSCDMGMYTFIVHGLDEEKNLAQVADRAPDSLTLSLDQLTEARNQVCSHKNRTLTFDPAARVSLPALKQALPTAIRLTAQGLLAGQIKTFSLAGLETWAKMIVNRSNKDGWLKVFQGRLLSQALRDVYESIQTSGDSGGLHRGLYADFLDEAAALLANPCLAEVAATYRALAEQWAALAEAGLPDRVKVFKQTRDLLHKRAQLFAEKGAKGAKAINDAVLKLQAIQNEMADFPLPAAETETLLTELRDRIVALHAAETAAAQRLGTACPGE